MDTGPIALRILGSRQNLTRFASGWEDDCEEAFVDFEIEGLSQDDWDAVEAYLYPGEAW